MRLLQFDDFGELILTDDLSRDIPKYAILSHTWGRDSDEVTFADLRSGSGKRKTGYNKIRFCGEKAKKDGLHYFWVDTCCINKSDTAELQRAITSMFRWYAEADKCYVYLSDVSSYKNSTAKNQQRWESDFRKSRWFTRGWTLQELIAPRVVEFFSKEEDYLGDKSTLEPQIHDVTSIPITALRTGRLSQFSVNERLRWAEKRETKWQEDRAYSLLGIFDISMSLRYGEGEKALIRLKAKIEKPTRDHEPHEDLSFREPAGICLSQAPYIDPEFFIGRATELDQMREALMASARSQSHRRLVLGGKGGIGKTQLAIAYALRHSDEYTSIFWFNAATEATLKDSFQSVAECIYDIQDHVVLEVEQIVKRVHRWLSDKENTQWLLIFDNHDEPSQFNLTQYYPPASHGAMLITTRRPDLVAGKTIHIEPLQQIDESLAILETRSQRKDTRTDVHARRLAERLGGLPIALATVGAYLNNSAFTFERYLQEYEKRWIIDPRRNLQLQEYQDRTLYTTWDISYVRLKDEDPDVAKLLKLLAYFDNQSVWYGLFHAGIDDDSPDWLREIMADEINFTGAMKTLIDYCFIEVQKSTEQEMTESWSMHNCVHDWTLAVLNKEIDPQLYWYAYDCVTASIDLVDQQSFGHVAFARLATHATWLVQDHFWSDDIIDDQIADRLNDAAELADLLRHQIQLKAAERMYLRTLAGKEKSLGPEDTSTLNTVNNLGLLYADRGKLGQAEKYYQRALAGTEKALGPEHKLTLDTVNNLGLLYADQGKLAEAEKYYQRALTGTEKALGAEHASTLITVNNLALLYTDLGKYAKAEEYYQRALAGKKKVLSPDHTSTLITMNNLGLLYVKQGKLALAEEYYQKALAGYEKTLGPEHTSTLNTVNNLGSLYRRQGKLDEAEQYYHRALAGTEKALGPEHHLTLDTINNLGLLYNDQRKMEQAEECYKRSLAGTEKALGPGHTSTLTTISNLGLLYFDQDRMDEAEDCFQRALAGYEEALGSEHGSTLDTLNNLGLLYADEGKLQLAEEYYQRALSGYDKSHQSETVSALGTAHDLGRVYRDQGKTREARKLFQRAALGFERVQGPDHRDTLDAIKDLDDLRLVRGRPEKEKVKRKSRIRERIVAAFRPSNR